MTKAIDTGIPEELKTKIISILKTLFPGCKIYLYGSRARGRFSQGSDLDIAIDCGKRLADIGAIYEAQLIMQSLRTPLQIEVADFYELPEEYRNDIATYRIEWKS